MLTKFKDLEHHQFYEGMMRMTHSHKTRIAKRCFICWA